MRALLTSMTMLMPGVASGYSINQVGTYTEAKNKYEIQFNWIIGDTGFELETRKGSEKKLFVHNGKVFYVCGNLGKTELDVLKSLKIDDQKLLASLEKGACQELSTDFTVRFFLSPWDAVTSIETGGGYSSGLSLTAPETEITGKARQEEGVKCVEFSRQYEISNKKHKAMKHTVEETACNASAVKWRQSFTRALGMTLIRKAGGKPLYDAINSDVKKMAGFSLSMTTKVAGQDSSGAKYTKTFQVKTTGYSEKVKASFALPSGYEVVDPQNLSALAAKSKMKTAGGKDSGNAVSDALKFLILGGNPATAVFKNLTEEGSESK